MDFAFYNVTYIREFTYMITAVCENTRMIWVFTNSPKLSPVRIICSTLTTLKNEQNKFKHVRVDEYGALEKSTDVTNLLLDNFNISMETTDGDV